MSATVAVADSGAGVLLGVDSFCFFPVGVAASLPVSAGGFGPFVLAIGTLRFFFFPVGVGGAGPFVLASGAYVPYSFLPS